MAEPQTTPQRDTAALNTALNTQMSGLPSEVRGAMNVRQKAAEAEAGVNLDVARKTRETLEPIQQRMGQEIATTQKQVGEIGEQLAKPFEIPKETVGDMAQLGALVSMIGVMLGSSGKQSAQNVISAMNGTLTGYKKGRSDMIAQAQKEFEVNMKRLQSLSQNAQTKLELASKVAANDTQKAQLLLNEFKAEHEGSIAAAKVAAGDAFSALTAANQIRQLAQSAQQHKERLESEEKNRQAQREAQRIEKEKDRALRREMAASRGTGGANNARYIFNITEAFGQATMDLLNITDMPKDTLLGSFAGMTGQSGENIVKSLANTFARDKLTSVDERIFQQLISGFEANMSRALGGGYANSSTKAMLDIYKQQVPKVGDSPENMAIFLARIKQELGVLAQSIGNHPGANEGFVNQVRDYMTDINQAIPFTVKDVQRALYEGRRTVGEQFRELSSLPVTPTPLPSDTGAATPGAATTPPAAAATPQTARPAYLNGREIVVKDGRWVYKDTGKPVAQ
jgi:hypothetical protein